MGTTFFVLPFTALAHGDENDGHLEPTLVVSGTPPTTHKAGSSELLSPGTLPWFGILFVSFVLMALLSYGVWKYLQVTPPKKDKPQEPTT